MTISDVIRPGDKIDLTFAQEASRMKDRQELPRIFKSQVLDVKKNGNLEISMPSEAGKLVLLPLGVRYDMVFFTRNGLFRAFGQVKERYKTDNVYMLEMEFKSQLEKYQRREYFRYPLILNISYYTITEEEANLESGEAIFIHLRDGDESHVGRENRGQVVDISGGGMRFNAEKMLEPDQYVLFELHLENDFFTKFYYIVGIIISCDTTDKLKDGRFEARARFMIKDDGMREEIIRFIFEEERKTRRGV